METRKKKGLMSAMKCELVRSLTPSKLRSMSFSTKNGGLEDAMSSSLRRRLSVRIPSRREEQPMSRSERLKPVGEALEPLMESLDLDGVEIEGLKLKRTGSGLGSWMKGQMMSSSSSSSSKGASSYADVRLLLGVMGAPLAPVHVTVEDSAVPLRIKEAPIVSLYFSLFEIDNLVISILF